MTYMFNYKKHTMKIIAFGEVTVNILSTTLSTTSRFIENAEVEVLI